MPPTLRIAGGCRAALCKALTSGVNTRDPKLCGIVVRSWLRGQLTGPVWQGTIFPRGLGSTPPCELVGCGKVAPASCRLSGGRLALRCRSFFVTKTWQSVSSRKGQLR